MSEQGKVFEAWGICELMGHQRVAGRISEQAIGGGNLLRVDIPNGEGFRTVYYGSSAIYALHVTDEAAARLASKQQGSRPSYAWELESAAKLPAPAASPRDARGDIEFGFDGRDDDDQDEIPL